MKLKRFFALQIALFLFFAGICNATTRAIQIDLLLAGLVHPTTGEAVASGTVYFYAAGTTTAKNVWTEKEKTNAYSSYSLSAIGTAQLYAEGNYKIVVKDSDGATVQTLDNIRLEFPYYGIRTVIQTGSQLSQDDFLLINTTSGAVTINALAAASWTRPLKIQRIAGSNSITLDPNGSETVDGSATLTWNSDAIVEIISDGSNLRTAGFRSSFADADNDTKIQVEESADEDIIRFDTAGTERVTITSTKVTSTIPIQVNAHQDADGDTKIQVEESADEDVIRFDIGGAEVATIDADGLTADEVDTPDLRISGTQITATAAEINTACDGITATASELNQLDGVTVGGNTSGDILTTDDTQSFSGKTSTDGFRVTGGTLKIAPSSGVYARITGNSVSETITSIHAGGYESVDGSGMIQLHSKDAASYPGQVRVYGTNGTTGTLGIDVEQDGTVDLPVGLEIGGVAQPKRIVYEIGDWNMDSTLTVGVAHGLTMANIVGVDAIIRNDDDSYRFKLEVGDINSSAPPDGMINLSSTNIVLSRTTSGYFDSTAFDATSYNRGYIIVDYAP